MKKLILIILSNLIFLTIQAAPFYELNDKVYKDFVQTVLFSPTDEPLQDPILHLNGNNTLNLSFDILGNANSVYNYTIVHCTYDWKQSDLQPIEYINGYQEDEIRDFQYSLNTLTPYVHYSLTFPGENLQPRLSGNYILIVYDTRNDAEHLLFNRRFMVIDDKATITAAIPQYPKNPDYIKTKHQVDVTVNADNSLLVNPNQSLNLVIKQNGRWDNAVVGLKPNYTYTDKVTYEYDESTVFEGGNQFRNFDMKSFKYQSEFIKEIRQESDCFSVYLWPSKRRNNANYVFERDIFGRKLIKARDDQESDIEGDYAWVNFFLDYPLPLMPDNIYIIGALNDWNLDEKSLMTYNFERKGYEGKLFLKQGYYNYLYGIVEKGQSKADVSTIEGNFWDTQYEYSVFLYFRMPGTAYDQLVGYNLIQSHYSN
ncbi:MAG: DUF5103 domain-containing protein [Bacteroidales bacterium]|nr:DUF5103 domain-containing protein [Bacteroidales bacterium]